MTLIEFETYSRYSDPSEIKTIYVNPEEVATIEQGYYCDCTVVYLKDGRNHCLAGHVRSIAALLTEGCEA